MKTDAVKQYLALQETLEKEKVTLLRRLSEIDRALGRGVSQQNGKHFKRAQNEMSLKEAVCKATRSRPLTRPEILAAVQKLGYKFTAKDPMNSLNTTLYTKGQFRNTNGRFSPAK